MLSSTGRPLAGATVTICAFGATGIPCSPTITVYTSPALSITASNPATSDGNGNVFVYAAPGRYTYTVTGFGVVGTSYTATVAGSGGGDVLSSGNNILTGNNTLSGNNTINASSLTVSGATKVASLLASGPDPWIDVTAPPYNATGNGVTDDTTAIQTAVSACPATGGTVFFPPTANSYAISSKITLNTNCNYVGVGPASKITYTNPATANFPMFFCNGGNNIVITGLNFSGSNAGGTLNFLWTNSEATINGQEGFFCLGCQDLELYNNIAQNLAGAGFLFVRGAREKVHDNISNGNSYYGFYLLSTDNGTPTDDTIWSNTARNNGCFGATCFQGRGIVLTTAGGVNPIIGAINTKIGPNNVVEGNSLWGIEVYNAARSTEVFSNIVSGNGFGGIHDLRNVYANIHDNEVFGNGLPNVPNGSGGTLAGITGYCISAGSSYYANVHDNNCHDNNSGGGNLGQIVATGEGNSTGAYGNKIISNHVRNNLAASGGFDIFVSATSVSSCPATARFYKIAAYDGSRNVLAVSAEQTNTPAATSVNLLTWKPIAGAFSYGVFESATTGTENQYYEAMAPAFLDECASPIATLSAPSSGTPVTSVTLTNLTTAADIYGTMVAHNDMFGSITNTPYSASDFNTISFDNPATVANLTDIIEQGRILPNTNSQALGSAGKRFTVSAYSASFGRSGGAMANGCDICGPFVFSPVNPLLSTDTPTISSGFGTSPSISGNNGTSVFTVNVGTGGTATTGVIGLPTANSAWVCTVMNITAQAANRADNTVQTASTTNTITIQNQTKSTGAAVAWTASDVVNLHCFAR